MADEVNEYKGFERLPDDEGFAVPPAEDNVNAAEAYIEAYDRHLEETGTSYNNDEAEAYRARLSAAAALFEEPELLGTLVERRPELLEHVDADRKAAEKALMDDEPESLRHLFGLDNIEDIDSEKMAKVLGDPVAAYVFARNRYIDMTVNGGDPEGAHLVRSWQIQRASEIAHSPAMLMRFGAEHQMMSSNLMGDIGKSEEISGRWAKETNELVDKYLDADKEGRIQIAGRNYPEYLVARSERLEAFKKISSNPVAFLFIGERSALEETRMRGKVMSDIDASRGASRLSNDGRFSDRYKAFREGFERKWNDEFEDPVKYYGRINNEIMKAETSGIGAENIVFLERLSAESAMKIADKGASVGKLASLHPELMKKWGTEVSEERERLGLRKSKVQVADSERDKAEENLVWLSGSQRSGEQPPEQGGTRETAKTDKNVPSGFVPDEPEADVPERDVYSTKGITGKYLEGSLNGHVFENMPENKRLMTDLVNKVRGRGAEHGLFLALPIRGGFGASGQVNSVLAKMDPDTLKQMFWNTVEMQVRLSKSPEIRTDQGMLNHDRLEMARRSMADVMSSRGIVTNQEIEIVSSTQRKFKSPEAKSLPEERQRDPGLFIERGETASRIKLLKWRMERAGKTLGRVRPAMNIAKKATNILTGTLDDMIR